MSFINIAILLLLIFSVTFLPLFLHQRKIKENQKQRYLQGLLWLKTFKALLTNIQQHRGLTMGYLHGDSSLLPRINIIKEAINKQIKEINIKKGWVSDNQIWNGINDHWLRLSINYTKYESSHNFRQHGNLIINILNLIEECADNHHLQELLTSDKDNANFLWSQLLTTAEHIGQVRAIGTSIAAAKIYSPSQKIKLNYLQNCIDKFLTQQNHALNTQLLKELLQTINRKILSERVDISAEAFFNLATSALDIVLDKFDIYIDELQTGISTKKQSPKSPQDASSAISSETRARGHYR
ncbi:hypothetical protein [Psychromonas sp. MME2]|uniref:hypothetical protein n=1 Tax=unclassified Psychromonas TaxID=2614957 RepID=UPI00339C18E4